MATGNSALPTFLSSGVKNVADESIDYLLYSNEVFTDNVKVKAILTINL